MVVHFHTPDMTERFIQSCSPQVRQLVVMVNEATDEDYRWINNRDQEENVSFFYNEENVGYARAVNRGVSLIPPTPDGTIAIFNSDVVVPEGGIAHMEKSLWARDDVVIAGPLQVDLSGRVTHAGIFGTLERPHHRSFHQRRSPAVQDIRDDCVTVSGSAYFVKRWWWDHQTNDPDYQAVAPGAVGAFLPVQMYFEETFCSYFAKHRGKLIRYDGTVEFVHEWAKSSTDRPQVAAWMKESRETFRRACGELGIPCD